jgi:hypothetical protein
LTLAIAAAIAAVGGSLSVFVSRELIGEMPW